jgi:type II secretory pathway pseudopilin PulG
MNRKNRIRGYMLVELLIVIALLAALISIAVPSYIAYTETARAAACLSNRHNIEQDKRASYMNNEAQSLVIDNRYKCPSGGVYAWLVTDPTQPVYPRVGCSRHYASLPVTNLSLFTSDLSNMSGFNVLTGKWQISNGLLIPTSDGQEHRIAFGDPKWQDYTISVNVTLTSGSGYGIYYRADGKTNISGYSFQYDPGWNNKFIVRRVFNGKEESAPFQTVNMPAGFPIYNTAHDISVTVLGSRQIIKIDGQTVLDFKDTAFASGMGGFRSWGNSKVAFDSVNVTP